MYGRTLILLGCVSNLLLEFTTQFDCIQLEYHRSSCTSSRTLCWGSMAPASAGVVLKAAASKSAQPATNAPKCPARLTALRQCESKAGQI